MLTAILIDTHKTHRDAVKKCLEEFKHVTVTGSFASLQAAADHLNEADIIFLTLPADIPAGFSRRLLNKASRIIVMSLDKKDASKAFDLEASGFIQLPITTQGIAKALAKVVGQYQTNGHEVKAAANTLFVRDNKSFIKLLLKDIFLIEAMDDYIKIHTHGKQHLISTTMKKMEAHLPEKDFARIHKSYIVRIDQVQLINHDLIIVANRELPVGPNYREKLLQKIKLT